MRGVLLAVMLAAAVLAGSQTDLYKVLELQRGAEEKEIKKAFRRLSSQWHPDVNREPEAKEKFIQIQRAYEVLTDKQKKLIYDTRGMQGLEEYEKNGGNNQQRGGGIFDIFGGGHGGMPKGHSMQVELKVPLKDLYLGTTKKVTLSRNEVCHECQGTGAHNAETHTCPHCQGRGVIVQEVRMGPGMVMRQQVHCPHCRGQGKTIKEHCHVCRGQRVTRKPKEMEVDIEKGMKDGQTIVFENEADQSPDYLPGDIIFIVRQLDDTFFQRQGDNLHMNLRVTLKESLSGFAKNVNHLDNEKVLIEQRGLSWPDSFVRIPGKGMPIHNSPGDRGDLMVKLKLFLPSRLTQEQKEAISRIL